MSTKSDEQVELPPVPEGRRIDGRIGCAIFFVIGLLSIAGAWAVMKQKAAHQLDAATELTQMVAEAETADGTAAVRAAGCSHAAVVPMEALGQIAQRLEDARAAKEKRDPQAIFLGTERAAIVCGVAKDHPAVSCKDVAAAFASAVKNAALPFVVVVESGDKTVCTEEFSGNPEKMKELEPLAIPPLFPAGS